MKNLIFNKESGKISISKKDSRILISDRMPFLLKDILIFLISNLVVLSILFLGKFAIVYMLFFAIGYLVFRYFAFIFWKELEIDLQTNTFISHQMFMGIKYRNQVITKAFKAENFTLKEFEQSGMQRAMLQYKTHKTLALILLTTQKDIDFVKSKLKEILNLKSQ